MSLFGIAPKQRESLEPAVVAHHPVRFAGTVTCGRHVARLRRDRAVREVALVERLAVDVHVRRRDATVSPGRPMTRFTRSLMSSFVRRRRLEHDDVAAVHRVQLVRELVDEHAVVRLQRRDHRLRRDVERLEQERLDQQRDGERGADQDHPLDRPASVPRFACAAARSSAIVGPDRRLARAALVDFTGHPLMPRSDALRCQIGTCELADPEPPV